MIKRIAYQKNNFYKQSLERSIDSDGNRHTSEEHGGHHTARNGSHGSQHESEEKQIDLIMTQKNTFKKRWDSVTSANGKMP